MPRKTNQFTVRLSDELLDEIDQAAKITGLEPQDIARIVLKSFVQQINAGDKLEFPFRFVANAEAPAQDREGAVAAEGSPSTGGGSATKKKKPPREAAA